MKIVDAIAYYVALNPASQSSNVALNPASHSLNESNAYYAYTALYDHWISIFGLPEILVTVNGTEFINKETTRCHLYNIEYKQTPNISCPMD